MYVPVLNMYIINLVEMVASKKLGNVLPLALVKLSIDRALNKVNNLSQLLITVTIETADVLHMLTVFV